MAPSVVPTHGVQPAGDSRRSTPAHDDHQRKSEDKYQRVQKSGQAIGEAHRCACGREFSGDGLLTHWVYAILLITV
jgi:hypothetical protein